ncbi:MAG: amidohydrolase family protein, partial [Actinomycetes bacterium]
MTPLVIADVDLDGRHCDVHLADGRVIDVRPPQAHHPSGAEVVDGAGGALLPGLHDHHIHLFALARAAESVDCSPAAAHDTSRLGDALRQAPAPAGWVRGVGYHESIAGPLDRHTLDRIRSDVPVRVQHRSGALWMLNSAALDRVQ